MMFQQGIEYERFYGPHPEPLELRRHGDWLPLLGMVGVALLSVGLLYLPS
jgi:hypothetical protein